ncbi:MAG: MFS transporter [Nanoarchaeota archaeon]|nr:MFS transporter [Nanoarchaeota archaeon]
MKRSSNSDDKKIRESLKLSLKEGAASSISSGLGFSYIAPFAIAMNATSGQIGILNGLINFLPTVAQLKASKLIEKFSVKKIVIGGVTTQAFLWILVFLTIFGFYFKLPAMIWVFIFFASLLYVVNAFIYPAWFLWMGLLVPEKKRGGYFSKRNLITGLFGLIAMLAAAFFLDGMELFGAKKEQVFFYTLAGFGVLFLLALLFRIISLKFFKKTYEPKIKIRKKDYFSYWQFLKRAPQTSFGRFTIFKSFFSIAIGISAPFFELYLLRDLGFSYTWTMMVVVSGTFFQLIFLPLLGKVSDRFGNAKLTKISSGLIFTVPILWMLSYYISDPILIRAYLLIIPSVVNGFAWAGYNLATTNYIYDSVRKEKRGFCSSYMNATVGLSLFIGAVIGTIIAWHGVSFINTILFIFLVSAILRFIVYIIAMRYIEEVRPVKKFSSMYLIREFKPLHEVIREVSYVGHLFEGKFRLIYDNQIVVEKFK